MPRFFVDKKKIIGNTVVITDEDALHISRSLRMRVGESLTLSDGEGCDYECEITAFTKDSVELAVVSSKESDCEMPVEITLFQGVPKGDKMDLIVQKAVECGASRIVPVEMKNCIVKLGDSADKKVARWQRIADEAAKQSQRGRLVRVEMPIRYDEALDLARKDDISFICYEAEDEKSLSKVLSKDAKTLSFVIGPEGGFDPAEVKKANECGIPAVSLGKRILRTETASMFTLAALSMYFELL